MHRNEKNYSIQIISYFYFCRYDPQLEWWQGGFTVMPKSQLIVLNDRINNGKENVIKAYEMCDGELRPKISKKVPCGHDGTRLLGLMINDQELLAVSCSDCMKIYLQNLNLETEQVRVAYSGEFMKDMCHGREGTMFVSLPVSKKVLELDCSSPIFTLQNTIPVARWEGCHSLCYVPPHDHVIIRIAGVILGVKCWDGSERWRVQREIEDHWGDPRGMLRYNTDILVADYGRILVVDPGDGDCKEPIPIPKVGQIHQLGLCNEEIVMLHGDEIKPKISFKDIRPISFM